ncbi:hypothetical protein [Rhizobium esperanzae]|uniref:Uncharacterized protein n=1 Tax=Rhizobium esperanzae TaxID=1967781 RepID=A0A7W6R4R3_9HYPH|nr:hypothetical protein [Rhizobium esperanzae]MBB4236851.1 hypothetical protein [Rhizobium esperanzae]
MVLPLDHARDANEANAWTAFLASLVFSVALRARALSGMGSSGKDCPAGCLMGLSDGIWLLQPTRAAIVPAGMRGDLT